MSWKRKLILACLLVVLAVGAYATSAYAIWCEDCTTYCQWEANQCSLDCPGNDRGCVRACINQMRDCEVNCWWGCS